MEKLFFIFLLGAYNCFVERGLEPLLAGERKPLQEMKKSTVTGYSSGVSSSVVPSTILISNDATYTGSFEYVEGYETYQSFPSESVA